MRASAFVGLVVTVLVACRAEPVEVASKPAPISAAKAAEAAHGGPLEPMDAEAPRPSRTATGSVEATIDGNPVTFESLPYGTNAVIDVPDRGVARVWISGSRDASGFPALRISLEHVRLVGLELPIDLPASAGAPSPAEIEIRYQLDDKRSWHGRGDGPEGERARVRIESFDGTTLRGTFSATLQPKSEAFGKAIRIDDGRFAVSMRRSDRTPRQ